MASLRFATLTPENAAARKCLELLVGQQLRQGPESRSIPVRAVQASPESTTSTHRAALSKYQLDLTLNDQGHGYNGAWMVGKFDPKSAAPIDLPICSARSRQLKGSSFCTIFIHPQSGVLVLRNVNPFHPIIYLQTHGDVELAHGDEHVLYMTTNHLRIGPLDFVLDISVDDETAYSTSRDIAMRKWHQDWDRYSPVHAWLGHLPRPTHVRIGDVIVHQTVAKGAFGVVRVGVDRWSGGVVATKTIHCSRREAHVINNEIDIAAKVLPNTVGLVHLIASSCEHGNSPPCFQSHLEDVHLIMPFAPFSFDNTAWHEVPLATRLELFRQVLEGLANLHTAGIMHRDISTKNLLVFSYQPPVAAICDFGKSRYGAHATGAGLGPPAFTAPEPRRQEEYTNAIDIFSMGLCMLATFRGPRWPAPLADPANHARLLAHLASLRGRVPDDLAALLRSMLAWDPAGRPSARQALASKIWQQAAAVAPGPEPESASETSSGGSSSGPGPSSNGVAGGSSKRFRRSDAPSRSDIDQNKRPRRSESAGPNVEERGLPTSGSLLSPPPA